jgi:leucyl aminopeptidase
VRSSSRFVLLYFALVANAESTDSIYAMNGKSVEVDNTDAEGRLILSGAHI